MKLCVNGETVRIDGDAPSVADLLARRGVGPDAHGVAVAVNEQVVPRAEWAAHRLRDGDTVEIIHAVQGG